MVSMQGNKAVLLIDDNQVYLETMQKALHKHGFECQTGSSLEDAIGLANDKRYDLIVCDYFMPDTDGQSVLDSLGMINRDCLLILTSSYPLDIKFKRDERFKFVDKAGLLDWLKEKCSSVQYV